MSKKSKRTAKQHGYAIVDSRGTVQSLFKNARDAEGKWGYNLELVRLLGSLTFQSVLPCRGFVCRESRRARYPARGPSRRIHTEPPPRQDPVNLFRCSVVRQGECSRWMWSQPGRDVQGDMWTPTTSGMVSETAAYATTLCLTSQHLNIPSVHLTARYRCAQSVHP